MTNKEKAEQYVRGKSPELMELSFGCEVKVPPFGIGGSQEDMFRLTVTEVLPKKFYYKGGRHAIATSSIKEIIGHPIQLQHWLRVLIDIDEWPTHTTWARTVVLFEVKGVEIAFNLTTGQPATEADYQAFCEVVGITSE